MEGAVLGGKLAAEVVVDKDQGITRTLKEVQATVVSKATDFQAKEPAGVKGDGAIAWGGGASFSKDNTDLLREVDPAQFEGGEIMKEVRVKEETVTA